MADFFVSSLSGASGRQAVVEQSGSSAWLFMTGRDGVPPIADCFLYNVPGAETLEEAPPPLDPRYVSDDQVSLPVVEDDVQIRWSVDGDAVAVHVHGQVVGFIAPDDLRGYSRAVNQDCDWAHRFDEELYRKLFS